MVPHRCISAMTAGNRACSSSSQERNSTRTAWSWSLRSLFDLPSSPFALCPPLTTSAMSLTSSQLLFFISFTLLRSFAVSTCIVWVAISRELSSVTNSRRSDRLALCIFCFYWAKRLPSYLGLDPFFKENSDSTYSPFLKKENGFFFFGNLDSTYPKVESRPALELDQEPPLVRPWAIGLFHFLLLIAGPLASTILPCASHLPACLLVNGWRHSKLFQPK